MSYLYLLSAILCEIIATTFLKSSDGFTKWLPSVVTVIMYVISFAFLSLTLRTIPTGIAYAIWSGVGIIGISIIAWFVHDQKLDFPAMLGMAFIVAGVVIMNVFSKSGH
ncbi:MAG: multidrug efflux SMR transporter [Alphaproteobacteria bacterium]|nr:multidrug efflux SMR transporter [Alphaproteobacteria bacterium]